MACSNKGYWPYRVEVGDVLQDVKGNLRVVRGCLQSKSPDHFTVSVDFAIQRCSWTRRPLTCLSYIDLRYRGFRPTGVRVKLDHPLDKLLEEAAKFKDLDPNFTCCHVQGIS